MVSSISHIYNWHLTNIFSMNMLDFTQSNVSMMKTIGRLQEDELGAVTPYNGNNATDALIGFF